MGNNEALRPGRRGEMKITDTEIVDFIQNEVEKIYYGEIRRRGHGWIVVLTGHEDRVYTGAGNAGSLRRTIKRVMRREALPLRPKSRKGGREG
jgi:hypothetical protein